MDYNYHTHTFKCHHASGGEEEYIKRAIEKGVKYMGFSDHFPLVFENGAQSYYRIFAEDVNGYISDLKNLREKYKNQIEIAIGFEMEYYPDLFDGMYKNAMEYGGEYLILGQHFSRPEYRYGAKHTLQPMTERWRLEEYVSTLIEAIKSGVFSYVAHPDIFNFVGDEQLFKDEFRRVCKASREYNIPLEINFLGIRDHRTYPNMMLWEVVGEEQSPVTFGFDSHTPKDAFDGESLVTAKKMVKDFNLNYIGKPKLIPIGK